MGGTTACSAALLLSILFILKAWPNCQWALKAWHVRNSCRHSGTVLPLEDLIAATEGCEADGVDAMACRNFCGLMMMMNDENVM
jgi:hypothetical protein